MQQGIPASLNSCLFHLQGPDGWSKSFGSLLQQAGRFRGIARHWHRFAPRKHSAAWYRYRLFSILILFPHGLHADLVIALARSFPFRKDRRIEAVDFGP